MAEGSPNQDVVGRRLDDEAVRHQAPGGWRRAVVGVLLGTGLGVAAALVTRARSGKVS